MAIKTRIFVSPTGRCLVSDDAPAWEWFDIPYFGIILFNWGFSTALLDELYSKMLAATFHATF